MVVTVGSSVAAVVSNNPQRHYYFSSCFHQHSFLLLFPISELLLSTLKKRHVNCMKFLDSYILGIFVELFFCTHLHLLHYQLCDVIVFYNKNYLQVEILWLIFLPKSSKLLLLIKIAATFNGIFTTITRIVALCIKNVAMVVGMEIVATVIRIAAVIIWIEMVEIIIRIGVNVTNMMTGIITAVHLNYCRQQTFCNCFCSFLYCHWKFCYLHPSTELLFQYFRIVDGIINIFSTIIGIVFAILWIGVIVRFYQNSIIIVISAVVIQILATVNEKIAAIAGYVVFIRIDIVAVTM